MKRALILLLFLGVVKIYSQTPIISESFYQKMMDFNLAWTDFDMPTKLNDREARFTAFQCKYFSEATPSKRTDCSKGVIQIEVSKTNHVPYFEFPEIPSCQILRLGIQAGDKGKICGIAIQRLENDTWVQIDETVIDAKAKCYFWEPITTKSDKPVKYRLVANKTGSVYLTDVYIE